MKVYKVNNKNYEKHVLVGSFERPAVVKFVSENCHLCVNLKPVYRELAKMFDKQYSFFTVDTDEEPDMAKFFLTDGVPTIVTVKQGETKELPYPYDNADELTGYPKQYLIDYLNKMTQPKEG